MGKSYTLQDAINDIKQLIKDAPNAGMNALIVEADSKKGFEYPYLLLYPEKNMRNTFIINCLNDYEKPMDSSTVENQQAIDDIFSLFGTERITATAPQNINGMNQESYDESMFRIASRIAKGTNHLDMLLTRGGLLQGKMPVIMPLIPGYRNDTLEHTSSEISKHFAGDIDIQVVKMIEDAKKIIKDRTHIDMDNQIIAYGHSKSATFANNFTTLHPEMVKALIAGGREDTILPLEEIVLRVQDTVSEDEQFEVIDGVPYKNITKEQLDKIISEYNRTREVYQREITQNTDGTYNLPLNYPIGVSDIEHYVDLSQFEGGKEEYIKKLAEIPRMIFIGEREEEVEGNFAYVEGTTTKGIQYGYAQDLIYVDPENVDEGRYETEKSSMHNRILEYKEATLALFGRGDNERLRNYMDLATKLGLDVQSKIYEGVGHRDIYATKYLAMDTADSIIGISDEGRMPKLNKDGAVNRVNPVFQLLRRAKVCASGKKEDYDLISNSLPKMPKEDEYQSHSEYKIAKQKYYETLEKLMVEIDKYIESSGQYTNLDMAYDKLSPEEILNIYEKISTNIMQSVISNAINQAGVSEIAENTERNEFLQNSYSNIPESNLSGSYTLLVQTKEKREKRSKAVEMEEEGITKDEQ